VVEDSIGLMKLRAVFLGDPGSSEVYMVGGRFGTLHVTAGGGGALSDSLQRWGQARAAGVEALQLEPMFDIDLLNTFNERALQQEFPDVIIDAARAERSYEGFPGIYDSRYFPLHGYWRVRVEGHEAWLVFRLFDGSTGTFQDGYRIRFDGEEGWRIGS